MTARDPDKCQVGHRLWILIPAREQVDCIWSPAMACKPRRVVVYGGCADHFRVICVQWSSGMSLGAVWSCSVPASRLVDLGERDAEFDEVVTQLPACAPGQSLCLLVKNETDEDRVFEYAWWVNYLERSG